MNKLALFLGWSGVLAAAAPAQAQQPAAPGFRHPDQNIQAPANAFHDLQVMRNLAQQHGMSTDEQGREVCADPAWQQARAAFEEKRFNMPAILAQVLMDSRHHNDRALAAYGMFYLDDPQETCNLIQLFPGEPDRAIREEGYHRAVEFLRVHLPQNASVETGDAPTVAPRYRLEVGPYLGLLYLDDPRDQAQGLWFLTQVLTFRSDAATTILGHARPRLRELLLSKDAGVREQARAFLHQADPSHRTPPDPAAADDALITWLDAVLYDVFPPIRRISEGLFDIYPSHDRDQVVEVGRRSLTTHPIGEPFQGKMRGGQFYRGFRVTRLPEPLPKLGIPIGAVITHVNGQPVAEGQDILNALEASLEHRRVVRVEFVLAGQPRILQYRLQP